MNYVNAAVIGVFTIVMTWICIGANEDSCEYITVFCYSSGNYDSGLTRYCRVYPDFHYQIWAIFELRILCVYIFSFWCFLSSPIVYLFTSFYFLELYDTFKFLNLKRTFYKFVVNSFQNSLNITMSLSNFEIYFKIELVLS